MRKVSKASDKTDISTPSTQDGINPGRRKNKRQDEKKTESPIRNIRRRKRTSLVEEPISNVFDVKKLKNGDRFTFLAPGKGKKTYICTVEGTEVLFERDDKHTYYRHLHELPHIVNTCNLECTLIKK